MSSIEEGEKTLSCFYREMKGSLEIVSHVALAVVMTACSVQAAAGASPTHVEIKETGERWETFPEEVCAVFVQDGKRVWYELAHPARREDLVTVKKIIKEQFNRPNPQVFGVSPVLFEPDGRVWFSTHSCRTMLSYDGKSFGEYPSEGETHYYVGSCPNTGIAQSMGYRHGCNATVGETVFLAESHGVLSVTADKPSYHLMTSTPPLKRSRLNYPVVVPEADGLGVLAHLEVDGEMILHRWRNGKWSEIDVPRKFSTSGIGAVVPWNQGAWVFQQGDSMTFVRYQKLDDRTFGDMAARLGDEKYADREEATKRLISMGAEISKELKCILQVTSDPEVIMRLKRVLAATRPKPGVSYIGPLQLEKPRLGLYEGGWMYITSKNIVDDGEERGMGVAVIKPDGDYELFLGESVFQAFGYDAKPLVVEQHAMIWTGHRNQPNVGAKLFDVAKGTFTETVSDSSFWWPHAVKSDGTVFLGRGESPHPRPVAVYKPDTRQQ